LGRLTRRGSVRRGLRRIARRGGSTRRWACLRNETAEVDADVALAGKGEHVRSAHEVDPHVAIVGERIERSLTSLKTGDLPGLAIGVDQALNFEHLAGREEPEGDRAHGLTPVG